MMLTLGMGICASVVMSGMMPRVARVTLGVSGVVSYMMNLLKRSARSVVDEKFQ
jgi:hypothetical protein